MMNHIEFAALEHIGLTAGAQWDAWLARVSELTGIGNDLDGDDDEDGYSLDTCHNWFCADIKPEEAASRIAAEVAAIKAAA